MGRGCWRSGAVAMAMELLSQPPRCMDPLNMTQVTLIRDGGLCDNEAGEPLGPTQHECTRSP
jgi:hypothetical protein